MSRFAQFSCMGLTKNNVLGSSMLKDRIGVDHIDMNFGCPAPKVTRNGGGAAIPVKRRLLASIVESAVKAAGAIPVTIKFRKGIDDEHLTFLDSGRIAQESGCVGMLCTPELRGICIPGTQIGMPSEA